MNDFAVVQLLWAIINQKTGNVSRVRFEPQKVPYDFESPIEQAFPRSTPEEQGIDPDFIASFVREMGSVPSIHMHQLMILRHDHVIYEGGFDPYPAGVWHVTYSMCKSFTNMAIGLLIDAGKLSLDDKLIDVLDVRKQTPAMFNNLANILGVPRMTDITIRHMLIMSTGVAFNEVGAITGNNWQKSYLESSVKFAPGSKFEYNSMNSYMLSSVVTRITGMSMFEFLKINLFSKMGITKVFWEKSPTGITKGGWGMFITQEDAAKLASLYMHGGNWHGEQLISRKWVEESTKLQISTDYSDNPGYGYHIWMDCRPGSFIYNGMLGQNVHCFPDIDMIVVSNAGNEEVFQTGFMTTIFRKYFASDTAGGETEAMRLLQAQKRIEPGVSFSPVPLPKDPAGEARLAQVKARCEGTNRRAVPIIDGGWNYRSGKGRHHVIRRSVTSEMSWKEFFTNYNGRCFHMNNKGIGLFPLIMQVVHTNYTQGISELTFHYDRLKDEVTLEFLEGSQHHMIPVGFQRGRHTVINMNGEEYLVGTLGKLAKSEDGIPVLSLRIAFVEEATERQLKIFFIRPDAISLHWSEAPGDVIITDTLEKITLGSGNANPLVSQLMDRMNPEFISRTMQGAIQPIVLATEGSPTEEEIDSAD